MIRSKWRISEKKEKPGPGVEGHVEDAVVEKSMASQDAGTVQLLDIQLKEPACSPPINPESQPEQSPTSLPNVIEPCDSKLEPELTAKFRGPHPSFNIAKNPARWFRAYQSDVLVGPGKDL